MPGMASAKTKRASVVLTGALLGLVLTCLAVWLLHGRSDSSEAGPLGINAGNTELVLPAPRHKAAWSATVGSFLLCSPGAGVTLTRVAPEHGFSAERFTSVTRSFEIHQREEHLVGEPVIGGYGAPPWIGGRGRPHEARLVGAIDDAEGARLTLPNCDETTGAPGEAAVELMLVLTAGEEGASFDGVRVEYESRGHRYTTAIPVKVTMCGTKVRDPDC